MIVKPAVFHRRALAEIRALPRPIRKDIGAAIWELQRGHKLTMPVCRPITTVANGAQELRIHDATTQYRVICVPSAPGILVVSAFAKRTRAVAASEIGLARRRLRDLLDEENGETQ